MFKKISICHSHTRNTQRSCTLRVSQIRSTLPCSSSISTCPFTLAMCVCASCLSLTSSSTASWSFSLSPSLWKHCWIIWEGCTSSMVSSVWKQGLLHACKEVCNGQLQGCECKPSLSIYCCVCVQTAQWPTSTTPFTIMSDIWETERTWRESWCMPSCLHWR